MMFHAPLALLALLFLLALIVVYPSGPLGVGAAPGSDARVMTYAGLLR